MKLEIKRAIICIFIYYFVIDRKKEKKKERNKYQRAFQPCSLRTTNLIPIFDIDLYNINLPLHKI